MCAPKDIGERQGSTICFFAGKEGCAAKVQGDRKALVALRRGRNPFKGAAKKANDAALGERLPQLREDWLDARLGALAALVEQGAELVADIGADHGRLACALLAAKPELRMIVADISADSLAKARALLERRGLADRAELRVADGLRAVREGEKPDAIVLAGMGGATLCGILAAEGAKEAIGDAQLLLQPNIEAPLLREWLCANGFPLSGEAVVRANGRYYVILRARRGEPMALTPRERALGPCLLTQRPAAYPGYLRWREQVLARALTRLRTARQRDEARECEIAREIAWIKELLE